MIQKSKRMILHTHTDTHTDTHLYKQPLFELQQQKTDRNGTENSHTVTFSCHSEANMLHADILMTTEDIF